MKDLRREYRSRSLDDGSNTSEHQSTNVTAFSCDKLTPLGLPVEPEVYRI